MSQDSTYDRLPHRYTEGDTAPAIAGQLRDDGGNPINIAGYQFTLRLERASGDVLIKAGAITDAANGRFVFGDPWLATDFIPGFAQVASIEVEDAGGNIQTLPRFLIDVERRLA